MRWASATSRTVIGLDVGVRQVGAVQLTRTGQAWRLDATMVLPRADSHGPIDQAQVRRIAQALARQGFVGKDVVLAVDDRDLLPGVLELPPRAAGIPFDQIARAELARLHHLAADSFEMSLWDVPASSSGAEAPPVVAIGCPHNRAGALLDAFQAGGLNVEALDVRPVAAARACAPLLGHSPGVTAIVNVGWQALGLTVVRAGTIVYVRTLPQYGLARLSQTLCERFGLEGETAACLLSELSTADATRAGPAGREALAAAGDAATAHFRAAIDDVRAPLTCAAHDCGPQARAPRVLLVGQGAAIPQLVALLAEELDAKVRPVALADVLGPLDETRQWAVGPELVAALGLARHAAASAMGDVNLIPAARRRAGQRRRCRRRCTLAVATYAAVLLVACGTCRALLGRDSTAPVERTEQVARRVEKTRQAIDLARRQLDAARLKLAADRAVGVQPDWGLFLAVLGKDLGDDVVLNQLDVRPAAPGGQTAHGQAGLGLEISGLGRSRAALSQFVRRLEQTELFGDVALTETRRTAVGTGQAVAFRLVCEFVRSEEAAP